MQSSGHEDNAVLFERRFQEGMQFVLEEVISRSERDDIPSKTQFVPALWVLTGANFGV